MNLPMVPINMFLFSAKRHNSEKQLDKIGNLINDIVTSPSSSFTGVVKTTIEDSLKGARIISFNEHSCFNSLETSEKKIVIYNCVPKEKYSDRNIQKKNHQ